MERAAAKQGGYGAEEDAAGSCLALGCSISPASAPAVPLVFERSWHDWIVMHEGQLNAFITYIRENPMRHWRRKSHAAFFRRVNEIDFLGRKWFGYGNPDLLKLPVIEPFRCSRSWAEDGPEWRMLFLWELYT